MTNPTVEKIREESVGATTIKLHKIVTETWSVITVTGVTTLVKLTGRIFTVSLLRNRECSQPEYFEIKLEDLEIRQRTTDDWRLDHD